MKITVLSHYWFDEEMKRMGFNDENVESSNMAFISIIGTPECIKYYLEEDDTKHYFKDHSNVLNLDFDDSDEDIMYNGHHFKSIRMEQAENAVDFIEENVDKGVEEIKVHCRAGFSRSRAVAEFIYRYCKENDIDVEYSEREEYIPHLNEDVLRKLNHAYWKKHRLNHYADGETNYPNDLINIPIKEINRERKKKTIENKQF